MPTRPTPIDLIASGAEVLNAVRKQASASYQTMVPRALGSNDPEGLANLRKIGATILNYEGIRNEFLSALVNRIGLVLVKSRLYSNPWNFFKKGFLEYGETVEEIFVELAKPHEYDIQRAETEVFKREIPDVRSAFHYLNYRKFYKLTIEEPQLRQAFLSWNGVNDLIARLVDSMYTALNYDEFLSMKYLLARHILQGDFYGIPVQQGDEFAKNAAIEAKNISDLLTFMNTAYNRAGVHTFTDKNDQYMIRSARFSAVMDVDVLASAFNMDRAEFMGHHVLVDSFGGLDNERLAELFAEDPNYIPITDAEQQLLDNVPAVIIDRDWFMIFDNTLEFRENYNGEGLYWNNWLHTWKTLSSSPFANAIILTNGAPTVTAVAVNPSAVTASAGQSVKFAATVATTNFAPQTVDWTATPGGTITPDGVLTIAPDATGTITVTATSTFDSTKTATARVTIA